MENTPSGFFLFLIKKNISKILQRIKNYLLLRRQKD